MAAKSEEKVAEDAEVQKESVVHTQKINGTKIVLPAWEAPRRCYQSVAEMRTAIANGTFDFKRSVFMRGGRLFFLCDK